VVVPPIGALAERVAGTGAGWILTEDEWSDESRMLERIAAALAPAGAALLDAAARRARAMAQPTPAAMAERSLDCYDTAFAAAAGTAKDRAKDAVNDAVNDTVNDTTKDTTPALDATAVHPFAAARMLAALGYAPWHPPQAAQVFAAPAAPRAQPVALDATAQANPRGAMATGIARIALRWGATPLGRAVRKVTPTPILEALKARLL
jgi:hypothetical protein